MLIGVDVGGTFTDAVLALDGRLITAKAPTTPEDQSEGVMAAIEAALERAGASAGDVREFSHGMTVATNALLEGRGARTAFVATEGFTDVIALGRQDRPQLYRLCAARPAPLAPDELRFGAPERMTPDGPLTELTPEAAKKLAEQIAEAEPEAVAVALLHSYRHPEHEKAIGDALAQALPDAHISLSHEVVGTFREYERAATTEIDAALSPLLASYLRRLVERSGEAGLPEPAIMQSNGGLIDVEAAAGHASWTVLSGPAGGAAGAAFVARQAGAQDALCLDMGGTSCDVCVVDGGSVQERSSGEIAGRPLALPMLAVHTVGAGGLDRLARRWRRASRRPAFGGRRSRSGVLRAGRHRADRHRREPRARLPVDRVPARRRRRTRSGGRGGSRRRTRDPARSRRQGVRRGDPPRRGRRNDPRAAGGDRATRHRPAPVRADGVRGCRRTARSADRR